MFSVIGICSASYRWTLSEIIIYFSVEVDFSGSEIFLNGILFRVSITIIAIWMTIFTFFQDGHFSKVDISWI